MNILIINDKEYTWDKNTISYEEICDLTKLKGWPIITIENNSTMPDSVYKITSDRTIIDAVYPD